MPAPIIIAAIVMGVWFMIDNVPFYVMMWNKSQGKYPGDMSYKAGQKVGLMKDFSFTIKTEFDLKNYTQALHLIDELEVMNEDFADYIDEFQSILNKEESLVTATDAYRVYKSSIATLRAKAAQAIEYEKETWEVADMKAEYALAREEMADAFTDAKDELIDKRDESLDTLMDWRDALVYDYEDRYDAKEIDKVFYKEIKKQLKSLYKDTKKSISRDYKTRKRELETSNKLGKRVLKANYVENLREIKKGAGKSILPPLEPLPPPPPTPGKGSLNITSSPTDMELSIDEVVVGRTPKSIEKDPGLYRVKVRAEGYVTTESVLRVTEGLETAWYFTPAIMVQPLPPPPPTPPAPGNKRFVYVGSTATKSLSVLLQEAAGFRDTKDGAWIEQSNSPVTPGVILVYVYWYE